jgi:serine/threonine protein phosphatase PrpC
MNAIVQTAAGNQDNQDRAAVIECSGGLVLVVADGAGGLSGGTEAAALAIELVRQRAHGLNGSDGCLTLLEFMDQTLCKDAAVGEATCALAVVAEAQVFGASVGDSGVWVINQTGLVDLTRGQSRKPPLDRAVQRLHRSSSAQWVEGASCWPPTDCSSILRRNGLQPHAARQTCQNPHVN